jgi:hypothetical protein
VRITTSSLRRIARLSIAAAVLPATAAAQVPPSVTHQGRLFDAEGAPVDATIDVVFAIYDDAAADAPIWSESIAITFDSGYFSALLGAEVPLDEALFDGSVRYLGIQVGDDPEMTPRAAIHSVPYAVRAQVAEDATGDIHPATVSVGGMVVIDDQGNWVGPSSGLVGPTGPQGATGAIGPTGAQGPAGVAGPTGPQGAAGVVGPTGPQGPAGAIGATGPAGATGPQGAIGAQGPAGATGATGAVGPTGAAGAIGPTGAVGPTGAIGPAGANGATGPIGATGPQGAPGPQGVPGAIGPTGPQGPPQTSIDGLAGGLVTSAVGINGDLTASGVAHLDGGLTVGNSNLVAGLNADLLDGFGAGNGVAQIPISNDLLNTGLVAEFARNNWKQCTFKAEDGTDNGATLFACNYTKVHDASALRLTWSGTLRSAYNCNACCHMWTLRVDGNECTNPGRVDAVAYTHVLQGQTTDLHHHRTFTGICQATGGGNIDAGNHEIRIYIQPCDGYGPSDGYTGWNAYARILVEELL